MADLTMYTDPIGEIVFGFPVRAIPFDTITTTKQLIRTASDLNGWALHETTGSAAATLDIYDGLDTTGSFVARINLTAGQSVRDYFDFEGIRLVTGIFLNVISGSVGGTIFARISRG